MASILEVVDASSSKDFSGLDDVDEREWLDNDLRLSRILRKKFRGQADDKYHVPVKMEAHRRWMVM